jgi:hypothetical protein
VYLRDERKSRAYRPIGYFCSRCKSFGLDEALYYLPKPVQSPKPSQEPKAKDEETVYVFSGPRAREPSGLKPTGQSPYNPPDIFSEIGDQ